MSAHSGSEPERNRAKSARLSDPKQPPDVLAGGPLLFTPEEAATVLRIGRTTVYALMKVGELHPVHIGRSCRLSRADLERYVRRLESPAPSRSRARRRGRTSTNQRSLFDLSPDPVDPA